MLELSVDQRAPRSLSRVVIDTNIPIVASGRSDHVCDQCRLAAIKFLMRVLANDVVCIDLAGECQAEYHRHLNPSGQPSVGDRFYQALLSSHPDRVQRVNVEKDGDGNFIALSQAIIESRFDLSDRKFAALSVVCGCPVYNCADSDWVEFAEVLENGGVDVRNLCGNDPAEWFGN